MTSRTSLRTCVAALALVLPVAGTALSAPAWAAPTANDTVYTVTDPASGATSVVSLDLTSRRSRTILTSDTVDYQSPQRGAGGRLVVSYVDFSGDKPVAGIAVVTGTTVHRLTANVQADPNNFTFDDEPTLSPDGSDVVFSRLTLSGTALAVSLYRVPSAATTTGTETAVSGGGNLVAPGYSPDGTHLVVTRISTTTSAQPQLEVLDLAAGTSTALGVSGAEGAYSPDGTTIAYSTQTAGTTTDTFADDVVQIATVPVAGGTPTVLARTRPGTGVTQARGASWLPDGRSLTFTLSPLDAEGNATSTALWAVDRAGTRAGVLATGLDEATARTDGPALGNVTPGTSSTFVAVTPTRLLDTRSGLGAPRAKVGARGSVLLQVTGATTPEGVIPPDATAVVLNVTAVNNTTVTNVRVFPSRVGGGIPSVSNINTTAAKQVVADLVTTSVGDGGTVVLYNASGTVDLLADVAGYYVPAGGVRFQPLSPSRILDSRSGLGVPQAAFGPAQSRDLMVTGTVPVGGGGTVTVPTTASAVVLNVTGTAPSTTTNVRVYPTPASGSAVPTVSNLNLVKGQTAPNLVTVAVGSGGRVRLFNAAGTVQLVADLAGYYDSTAPGVFVPVDPLRLLDTRNGTGAVPLRVGGAGTVDVQVAGDRGVPAGALAAVLTLTGTATSTSTVVRAYPSTASSIPTVSNLNLVKADTRANAAVVKPGTTGYVRLLNGAGTTDLLADLAGYFVSEN